MPAKQVSAAPLAKKLKLKPGARAAIINAPDGYLKKLNPPNSTTITNRLGVEHEWVQIFVRSEAELKKLARRMATALAPEALLWVTFPKGTSKIQTDLTRDHGWDSLQKQDLKWVTLVSIDETWSAFALRRYKPGEKRQT